MKHTKGTWVKGTNTAKKDWMKVYCNNKLIAEVKELSKKGERKATDFDEEAANIALIAAAPELLEILIELMEEDNKVVAAKSPHNVLTIQKAMEIIKKATL